MPRKTAACLLAGLLTVSLCAPSFADNVSVSTYSDLRNAALNAPLEGRVITVAPGTYNQGVASIALYDKPNITIQGATGNPSDVVIVGMGINNSGLYHNVYIDTCPNFTIQHVTLKNSYYHAVSVNDASHNVTIRNCILLDNGEAGVKATHGYGDAAARYSDYGIVENCWIGFTTTGMRSVVEGIDLIATKGWIIRNNLFVNVTQGVSGIAYGCFPKGNAYDSIIENNYFYNCDIAASFGGGGTGAAYFRDGDTTYEHRNGIIRNNIMVGSKDAAVYLNKSLNAKVYNNLSYKCVLTFQGRFAQTSASFRNNIAVVSPSNPGEPIVRWRDSAVDLGSSNNVYGADSWFVAPAISQTGDFHLTALATGAINAGISLPADVPTDYDGVTRPQGAAFDIGPYERIVNRNPLVNAGADLEVVEGDPVQLHAAASDPDNDPLGYSWQRTAGKSVVLAGGSSANASFTAPTVATVAEAAMTFQVNVQDGKGGQATDTVSVRVRMVGDIYRDDAVDLLDLLVLADAWGSASQDANYDSTCDLNGDGSVDVIDLLTLAGSWGRILP